MITFPEAVQYLQKDDITQRQGDPVKPRSIASGKVSALTHTENCYLALDFKLRGLA